MPSFRFEVGRYYFDMTAPGPLALYRVDGVHPNHYTITWVDGNETDTYKKEWFKGDRPASDVEVLDYLLAMER